MLKGIKKPSPNQFLHILIFEQQQVIKRIEYFETVIAVKRIHDFNMQRALKKNLRRLKYLNILIDLHTL